jgi:hypothetical protein
MATPAWQTQAVERVEELQITLQMVRLQQQVHPVDRALW